MLAGISKLPPAHHLVADRSGITLHRYWDAAAAAAAPARRDDPAALREVLLASVERELMSDVPVGVFTSGGLDSSLLAAAAAPVMAGLRTPTDFADVVQPRPAPRACPGRGRPRPPPGSGALGPVPPPRAGGVAFRTRSPAGPPLTRLLWLDFLSYRPDNLPAKVDRGTMLASIEARAPYLDREVMELALPLPAALKVRGFTGKAILKEAARGLVPGGVIRRRKRGLSVPVARWLNSGLAALAQRHLTAPPLVPGAPTVRLLAEHRSGRRNHARKLWPLLMAELWAERWNVDTAAVGVG